MQVSQIKTDDTTTAQYSVTVPAQDVATAVASKLTEYGKDATIAGFRKGKTPLKVLQKRYGDAALKDYINATVQQSVENIAKENNLKVALQPDVSIESVGMGEPLEFQVIYTLLPNIELMDISKLKLTSIKAKVDDSQVDDYINKLAKQSRESKTVKRAAKNGDMVIFDFVGSIDGMAFEGGSASDHDLELGSGAFIPGFEDQLVGVKAGDSKDVTVTFPEQYEATNLAGKKAVFACEIKEVKAFEDAVVDDEMAKKFGLESLDALKQSISERFANQFVHHTRPLVKKEIMDAFDDAHKFDVPKIMLDQEFEDMWLQIAKAKEEGQLDAEDIDKSEKQLKQEYLELANRRVRLGLILKHIASEWNIEVTDDDINQAIMHEAQKYPDKQAQVFEYYQKNPQIIDRLRAPILEEKVIDAILEKADITEKEMTSDEILALIEADNESAVPTKKTTAKKSKTKKSATKKATSKKTSIKKATAKKATTKKATAKKSKTKKASAKKA